MMPSPTSQAFAVALLLTACTHWEAVSTPPLTEFPLRRQVQIWRGGHALELHAVRVDRDSLSGIPYWQSVTCDSCRVHVSRTEIDSIRTGSRENTGFVAGALPFVALGVAVVALRLGMDGD